MLAKAVTKATAISGALIAMIGCSGCDVIKWVPDNPVEQYAEQVLKEKTGVDVDFTPEARQV